MVSRRATGFGHSPDVQRDEGGLKREQPAIAGRERHRPACPNVQPEKHLEQTELGASTTGHGMDFPVGRPERTRTAATPLDRVTMGVTSSMIPAAAARHTPPGPLSCRAAGADLRTQRRSKSRDEGDAQPAEREMISLARKGNRPREILKPGTKLKPKPGPRSTRSEKPKELREGGGGQRLPSSLCLNVVRLNSMIHDARTSENRHSKRSSRGR